MSALFLLGLTICLVGCEEGTEIRMPPELVGSWRTSTEAYQDRYLMMTPLEVRFGADGGDSAIHPVAEVREILEQDKKIYRIAYLSNDAGDEREYWLSVEYRSHDRTLLLVNQPGMVWERALSFD